MADKDTKRAKQYYELLIEERNALFESIEKLITIANLQVQNLQIPQISLSRKMAIQSCFTKFLVLLSELNYSVLKCLETVNLTEESSIQDLQDYLKADQANITESFDCPKEGPKVFNDEAQNNSYVRKPLDDTTLKAICSTFMNNSKGADIKTESLVQQLENSLRTSAMSLCTESSSGTCQHPLATFGPPTEIPEQYDTSDLEKVKENMRYISRKMGFDSDGFAQMSTRFNKALTTIDFQDETPVKDMQTQERPVIDKEVIPTANVKLNNNSSDDHNESEELASGLENALEVLDQNSNGPSKNTGAIRKQSSAPQDLIEFSSSTSDSESYNKITSWLTENSHSDSEKSENEHSKNPSAIGKLRQIKRCDRNEEAREKARADMPDLKLIPVETPQVIRNDLSTHCSYWEKPSKDAQWTKQKIKDLNKDTGVTYKIQQMDIPEVEAVCVFSHIVSPSEFYLQILNDVNGAYLDKVSTSLDEKFSKTKSRFLSKREASASLGEFCYGYIWGEKKAWYRLQVVDWKLDRSSEEVEVQSIDYGFRCTTLYTYLRELTEDLAHIPMLATKCHFSLLYPLGSTYSNRLTEWPISTVEALYDIANLSRDLTQVTEDIGLFRIIFSMLDGDSVGVDLVNFSEPRAESLGQLLINMELAVEIADEYEDNPELGDFLEDINELEKADNLNEFLLGYDAKDEARICQFTRKDGSCYKGKHCKLEHVQLKDGYTTDKAAVFYTAINNLIFPNKGDPISVLVTSYINSCTYFVQLVRNPVKKPNTDMIMDKDISDLMDAMNHPKLIAKYVRFKIYPAVGEIVLAYNVIIKNWLRTAVRALRKTGNEESIEVYSVDFGVEFLVNIKNVRVMQEEFMHVPFQVIQVYLDNFQHKKECDSKKVMKFFNKHIAFRNFLAYIKSSDLPYKVGLTTFKGCEIGHILVKEGLAEPRTADIFVTEDRNMRMQFDLE